MKYTEKSGVRLQFHVTQTSPIRAHIQTFDTEAEAREYARMWIDWNPHASCVVVGQGERYQGEQ